MSESDVDDGGVPSERRRTHLEKFKEGLERWTGDRELSNYRYYGGDSNSHLQYFLQTLGRHPSEMPERRPCCVCGVAIVEQCFLEHLSSKALVVVGNCCIKRYVPKSGRTCDGCGARHRNRRDNLCRACRSAGVAPDRPGRAPSPPSPEKPSSVAAPVLEARPSSPPASPSAVAAPASPVVAPRRPPPPPPPVESFEPRPSLVKFPVVPALRSLDVTIEASLSGVPLFVPYERRDEAKRLGARWHPEARRWYAPLPPSPSLLSRFAMVFPSVPYSEKDAAKALGARWDPESRRWYACASSPSGFASLCERYAPRLKKSDET